MYKRQDKKFPGDSQEVVIPKEKEEDNTEEKKADISNNTEQTLDIDNYRELQKAMNDVATEAGKSVVEIIGVSGEQDWTDESYDNKNSVSGLIIASAFSSIVVYATDLMPDKIGMIAGIFFGLMFGLGGLGSAFFGWLADKTSIEFIFRVSSLLPLLGIIAGFLPNTQKKK